MQVIDLQHKLFADLKTLKLPVEEVDIYIRPFSKSYYGRYFPNEDAEVKPKIYVYPFNSDGTLMSYRTVLNTVIHEMCHHVQYAKGFERHFGVMHDAEFWKLFNMYSDRAERMKMYDEETRLKKECI